MGSTTIGWASREVSTNDPVNLPGQMYERISEGVRDPLYLSALYVSDGNDSVIFVSVDSLMISADLPDEIKRLVTESNPEVPVDKIIFNATHTHESPSHDGTGAKYRRLLTSKATEAICEAFGSAKPGGIAYGYGFAVTGHNRRVILNGVAVMYGETNANTFANYESGADSFVNLMFTLDTNGELTGIVINVSCPSQCSEEIRMLSADFWCETRAAVKKKFGDVYVLPQCAAAGDVAPRILHYKKAQNRRFALKYGEDAPPDAAERADIAERIVAAAEEVYSWAKKDIKTGETIAHASKTLELEGKYKTEIRAVKIGEIAFAANQFELFTDYMHRIQARSPFAQTFVIQLAAGGGTYLATERAHASKGYGANEDNAVSPDGGRELVEETLELLRSIC